MTMGVTTVDMEAGIVEAVDEILSKKFGCLPVIDKDGYLVDLITKSDCLRWFRRPDESGLVQRVVVVAL